MKKLNEQIEAGQEMITEEYDLKVSEIKEIHDSAENDLDLICQAFYAGVYRGSKIPRITEGAKVPSIVRNDLDRIANSLENVIDVINMAMYCKDLADNNKNCDLLDVNMVNNSLVSVTEHLRALVDDLFTTMKKL